MTVISVYLEMEILHAALHKKCLPDTWLYNFKECHGWEICYPGNCCCQDVVPPAAWSRTRVRKLSGALGNVFAKVWIDSLRLNSSDACSSDLVANSVKTKGLLVSSFYEVLLFIHLGKMSHGEAWNTLCFVLTGLICISDHAIASSYVKYFQLQNKSFQILGF